MAVDVVRESAQAGRVVLWEESPRDGAQAKTLMTADFRVRLARAQGEVFGGAGPRHVVFAAGFPAVCREEFEAVRKVAVEAEGSVSVSAVCRGTPGDVRQALAAVRGSTHARIMVIVPASEAMARVMTHTSAEQALTAGAVLVAQARETDGSVAVDVCLADASRADHALVAEHAARMTAAGAGEVVLADTVGDQLPEEAAAMFTHVRRFAGEEAVLASHLHNDLGLALANTLQAVRAGIRVLSASWLGIAECSGMVATEQLLFLLAYHPERTRVLLGDDRAPWWTAPGLSLLPGIARMVATETGAPLGVTTPIVGDGVATISTGTPFVHPRLFEPYDPAELLGIEPRVVLTHLASTRVITAVAARLGHQLDANQARTAADWVKSRAYGQGHAVVDEPDFADYLRGLTVPVARAAR
ncbi:2-isopropylmalate synthase [Streptomyces laculatispora]|uniref:2-isopropylmalate synthase n=1 Tax=Streptomyces laculatispora TaxID=887464 RepID=A0ABY9HWR6_9ACTN|nr:2-isopropylmalate synthase [Streptomyces laculatispora]WLQ38741.1 2-isopropylmalate synthase [Streptomyces laculatispora]